jgi:hypothetical protein
MCMRKTLTITIMMALLGLPRLYSQQGSIIDYLAECERKYGSDADLVNGEKYFYPYRQAGGNPFMFNEPRNAVITIHEKKFPGQQLRYDIYNQKLVLDYTDLIGAASSLVLRNEWVESFVFENYRFVKMQGPDGKTGFYQLVTEGPITCVYKWSKNYLLNLTSGMQSYYFSEPIKQSFLLIDGRFFSYRNNGTFLKAFNSENQKLIRQFMRQSKIKVKKAPDSQMRHLVEYCNSIYHEDT